MTEFSYTARSVTGDDVAGSLTAASKREALALLANRALFPLKVEAHAATRESRALTLAWRRRVRTDVLAACLTQLADLLENGVPLLAALKILADESPQPLLREVMKDIHDQVADGTGLDDAMMRHSQVFSELTISMVRAGTEGAFLEDALRRVAIFLERQEDLKGQVVGAMAYPIFLAIVGTIVTVVLVVFFVPKFDGLFQRLEQSGAGLPLATEVLLFVSDLFRKYGYLLAAMAGGLAVLLRRLMATERAICISDQIKLQLPIAGGIFHNTAVARVCRVLGTLLHNGVPILKALRISSASAGNRLLGKAILDSAENISSGESLSRPLADSGLIPPTVMAMIRVAEEANTLDAVLLKVADRIEYRIQRQLALMVRLLEPIMLVLIGGMVLFILVALLLPVIEMSTTVG